MRGLRDEGKAKCPKKRVENKKISKRDEIMQILIGPENEFECAPSAYFLEGLRH